MKKVLCSPLLLARIAIPTSLSCLPRMMPFLLLSVMMCGWSLADITFTEIAGSYNLRRGNLDVCTDVVEIRGRTNKLKAQDVLFGGVPCSSGSIALKERDGLPDWNADEKKRVGIIVAGSGSFLFTCRSQSMWLWSAVFMRPNSDTNATTSGYVKPYPAVKGVRYFVFYSTKGSCVYRFQNVRRTGAHPTTNPKPSDRPRSSSETEISPTKKTVSATQTASPVTPSPSSAGVRSLSGSEAPSPSEREVTTGNSGSKGNSTTSAPGTGTTPPQESNDGLNIWVWLGPVLGAVATIAAALLTMIKCSRQAET